MKIHEYQAKEVFARYGIPIPAGRVADTVEQAVRAAGELGYPCVLKAQVHVGGRGKAGGIKLVRSEAEAANTAQNILSMQIKGLDVAHLLVEQAVDIAAEYYLGITLDRARRCNVLIVSSAGGIDIEEVAAETPEKVIREPIDPAFGLLPHQIAKVLHAADVAPAAVRPATRFITALERCYREIDASLAEINPLVLTRDGQVIAADAKINVDDNALFRQPDLAALKEDAETDPLEAEARRRGLQFVRLGPENIGGARPMVGVIGNGAGLVMGTLDEVTRVGRGQSVGPANFLDIGGGARSEQVRSALDLVLLNPDVEGVLINIFGGITRCDEVARGILEAAGSLAIELPMVIRLTGTNEEEGRRLLADDGRYQPFTEFGPAVQKIVQLVAARAA